jgi:hypothetical protein
MYGMDYILKHIITKCQIYEDTKKNYQIFQQIGEALGPDPQLTIKIKQFIKKIKQLNLSLQ